MGLETMCKARWAGEVSEGKLHLEMNALQFRGAFRLDVPLNQVKAEVRRGDLRVEFAGGTAIFELGPDAEKWALKIRYPKGRLDKLGVKSRMQVSLVGLFPSDFIAELRDRTGSVSEGKAKKGSGIVFLAVKSFGALQELRNLEPAITMDGAIWIVYPKGRKDITQAHVMAVVKEADLVDTKICSFSDTHTALKAMIPVSRRQH